MKNLTILAITALVSISSFAGTEPMKISSFKDSQNNYNYFDELGQMFATGVKPDLAKLLGMVWSGRCFSSDAPSKPSNDAYVFRSNNSDVGPIAGNAKSYEFANFSSLSGPDNIFDSWSIEQIEEPDSTFVDVQIESDQIRTWQNCSIKVSGKFLVQEIKEEQSKTVFARCYYFSQMGLL